MKQLEWVGSSKKDLCQFPLEVRKEMGYALYLAQIGERYEHTKPFKGFSSGIYEILSHFDKNAYRSLYMVNLDKNVYVLHAFQKKSKRGIKTPREELAVIKQRLKQVKLKLAGTIMAESQKKKVNIDFTPSSGNVFADLGIARPEEYLAKAKLAHQINKLIKTKKLKQKAAAELLGIDQPKISALNCGRLSGFSLERLIHFLTLLDQDVKIVVKKKPKTKPHGGLTVAFA